MTNALTDSIQRKGRVVREDASQIGDFRRGRLLGCGGFGSVFLGTHTRTSARYAIKRAKLTDKEELHSLLAESQLLQTLRHDHIIGLAQVLHTSSSLYLVEEYFVGGVDLLSYVGKHGRASPARCLLWCQQLTSALSHCHAHRIVHCDIKPENILVSADGSCVKLIDFGQGRYLDLPHAHLTDLVYPRAPSSSPSDTTGSSPVAPHSSIGGGSFPSSTGHYHYHPHSHSGAGGGGGPSANNNSSKLDDLDDLISSDVVALGAVLHFAATAERLPCAASPPAPDDDLVLAEARLAELPSGLANIIRSMLHPVAEKRLTLAQLTDDEYFLTDLHPRLFPGSNLSVKRSSSRAFLDFGHFEEGVDSDEQVTEAEHEAIHAAFERLDADQNGFITRDELRDSMIRLRNGGDVAVEEVDRLLQVFASSPGSGDCDPPKALADSPTISYEGFYDAWVRRDVAHSSDVDTTFFNLDSLLTMPSRHHIERDTVLEVRKSFDLLDESHCGLVTKGRLVECFAKAQQELTDSEAESLIEVLTSHHHHDHVSFDEFLISVVQMDLLVKHPLGPQVAKVTNLIQLLHEQELEMAQRHGITLSGTPDEVVGCLRDAGLTLVEEGTPSPEVPSTPTGSCPSLPGGASVPSSPFPTTPSVAAPASQTGSSTFHHQRSSSQKCRRFIVSDQASPAGVMKLRVFEGSMPGYTVLRIVRCGSGKRCVFHDVASRLFNAVANERNDVLRHTAPSGESEWM